MYPEWVLKYHSKGTSIKEIKGNYYLYKVTSKRVKGKLYPVSIQKYVGKITEKGIIKPEKIAFIPGVDNIVKLGKITECSKKDKEILNEVSVIEKEENYYAGKLTSKEIEIIKKYYNYENGKIWR